MTVEPREERKARLAEATWRIIENQGIAAVSVRTVAAEAGMAVGSLRHLFPTQAQLLEFSAELMIERATARITALTTRSPDGDTAIDVANQAPDPIDYALAVIAEVMPLTAQSRAEFDINIALIAATPGSPGLAPIRDRTHAELLDLFARIVAMLRVETGAVPSDTAASEAKRLLALVDGLGLHLIQQPPNADTAWAVHIVRDELERARGPHT